MSSHLCQLPEEYTLVATGEIYSVIKKQESYFLTSNRSTVKKLSLYDIVSDTVDFLSHGSEVYTIDWWDCMVNSNPADILDREAVKRAEKLELLDAARKQIREVLPEWKKYFLNMDCSLSGNKFADLVVGVNGYSSLTLLTWTELPMWSQFVKLCERQVKHVVGDSSGLSVIKDTSTSSTTARTPTAAVGAAGKCMKPSANLCFEDDFGKLQKLQNSQLNFEQYKSSITSLIDGKRLTFGACVGETSHAPNLGFEVTFESSERQSRGYKKVCGEVGVNHVQQGIGVGQIAGESHGNCDEIHWREAVRNQLQREMERVRGISRIYLMAGILCTGTWLNNAVLR
ncbi:unnamed protein product [Allacma fusca]|uniref:Uncharacterized protein n=1 Tax=Allacma fusca TaxID=39272 RepID=A0A8J2NSD6_9HEXA|nr:unnamed protein product [Allacma fusca]